MISNPDEEVIKIREIVFDGRMALFLLFKIVFELGEKLRCRDMGSGRKRSSGGGDGGKLDMVFEPEESRKTTNGGGMTIEGTARRMMTKVLKVEINF